MIIEYKRKIFGFECDIYGHLNNAAYLNIYEEARSEVLDQLGYPIHTLMKDGLFIYVTEIDIRFKKEIQLGTTAIISTHALETSRVRFKWFQDFHDCSGNQCNTATVSGAFIRNGKPWRIPNEMLSNLQDLQT